MVTPQVVLHRWHEGRRQADELEPGRTFFEDINGLKGDSDVLRALISSPRVHRCTGTADRFCLVA